MSGRTWLVWTVLMMGAGVVACEAGAPVAAIVEDSRFRDADGITIGGTHVFLNSEGVRESYMVFDTMLQWRDSLDYHLIGVNLTVNFEDGSERVRVTADQGRMDSRGDRFVARGNVVLVVPDEGRRLESVELHYDPNAERIWSDSAFVMTVPGRNPVRGQSFTSDLTFENFSVRGTAN
jgi:LPS export ABC transporter protein LptC